MLARFLSKFLLIKVHASRIDKNLPCLYSFVGCNVSRKMSESAKAKPSPTTCNIDRGMTSKYNYQQNPTDHNLKQATGLSKRAQKRLARKQFLTQRKQKKKKSDDISGIGQDQLKETDYYFENGLRKVYPYRFTFQTYAKGRWVGQKLLDVFTEEFRYDTPEIYKQSIEEGLVKVNGQKVDVQYKLKANDFIENTLHRHELPVTADEIEILENNDNVLVVNKPSSMPIHPCGQYRHNSLMYILAKEHGIFNLRTFYRIDRLTSGLMIFPKTEAQTNKMTSDVVQRKVLKTYVCKVDGQFPQETVICEKPLGQLDHKLGLHAVDPAGKDAKTTFQGLSYDPASNTSVVKCEPHTGRTHQIRVHLQWLGFPITNDPLYNSPAWGPERGKNGHYGKPIEKLIEDLKEHHSVENLALPAKGITSEMIRSLEENAETPNKKPRLDTSEYSTFEPSKLEVDPRCAMCKLRVPDPTPEKLVMYLHALNYKGSDWEFSTMMPLWAQP